MPAGGSGVKNTTDPRTERPIEEPSGPVLQDSLAAESATHGGTYSANRGAQPIGATSQNTTANTTDTSAATKLPPAADSRDREEPYGSHRYPDSLGGQANFPGPHVPESGYVGGPTAAKKDLGINQHAYPASEKLGAQPPGSGGGNGRQTRSTTAAQKNQNYSSAAAGQGDEFPDDPKYNASFNSEIGSSQDPGRAAEQKFQRREAETSAGAAGPAQKSTGGDTWWSGLNTDQQA